jgi:hypothetical protein
MPEVRLLPRFVTLVGMALLVGACASNPDDPDNPHRLGNPCLGNGAGSTSRQAPIVCVDNTARTLRVSPETVTVHDSMQENRSSGVMLHWFTTTAPSGDLKLEIEAGCVTAHECDRGHCWARSIPGAAKTCKYDVWITGDQHERLDPTIIIQPCCT